MEYFSVITDYLVPFLAVLTVLVFVHEMGHFLLARRNGVKVEVFSIGFGPELWGFNDKLGTRWRFSAVPLGGYVKMFGEGDLVTGVDDTEERPMTDDEKKVSFHHKRLGQRAAIVAAGPAANFLFAVLVLWSMNSIFGVPKLLPQVGEVIADTAAAEAGLQSGDLILAIDGQSIELFSELSTIVSGSAGKTLALTIQRGAQEIVVNATPRPWQGDTEHANGDKAAADDDEHAPRGLLGVRPDASAALSTRTGVVEGLVLGVEQTYTLTANILKGLGEMFSGDRSAKELGGVIMIAEVSGNAAEGGMASILYFMAVLSINLGLINLFPVPVLDGGHLAFYAAEGVRGKPLSP
ncbi:MAG TPA: RIP metalloprotease RseP, partial [Magnetovibrio sp.]